MSWVQCYGVILKFNFIFTAWACNGKRFVKPSAVQQYAFHCFILSSFIIAKKGEFRALGFKWDLVKI